jgi:beta-glucanase (GH16 family)
MTPTHHDPAPARSVARRSVRSVTSPLTGPRARRVSAAVIGFATMVATVTVAAAVDDDDDLRWAVTGAVGDARPVARSPQPAQPPVAELPVGDLPGWRQVFVDDFLTDVPLGSFPAAVSANWEAYPEPWRDTSRNGSYAPERVVSVDDGVLRKHIRTEGGQHLVAALLPQVTDSMHAGLCYGRFAIRYRTDSLEGYKMAWLLWPDSEQWSRDGEIDFPERNLDSGFVAGVVHHRGGVHRPDKTIHRVPVPAGWQTAVIEWSPGLVVFLLDGVEVGRVTERVPDDAMHWVIQTETAVRPEPPAADVAGIVEIDWVAAWSYVPG